ncbi:MAG: ATP-binding cassette domain-containing protein [Planctomycetota bacterium]
MILPTATRSTPVAVGSPTQPLLRLREARFAYHGGQPLLDGIDLDLHARRVHCLLGPSGVGKSTLLRLIAGLDALDAGRIEIDGEVMDNGATRVAPERRPVGFLFQEPALFPHLTVRANVCFGMNCKRRERHAWAEHLLERVDLAGLGSRMPHTLSGGQQQRVALVRALARQPRVMLLDEPFVGLDQQLRDRVRTLTLDLLRESGVATLMVTHDLNEASLISDHTSTLDQGRLKPTA